MNQSNKNTEAWLIIQKIFAIGSLIKNTRETLPQDEHEQLSFHYGAGEIITSLCIDLYSLLSLKE